MECGLYSHCFLFPKKDGALRPILDFRQLNRALAKCSFKMITLKQILAHIQPRDWFISVDLKDTCFHIQIAPRHRRFLRFVFEGRSAQNSPIWVGVSPENLYKVCKCSTFPSQAEWDTHPELSG